ncbi:MAG: hypothetical protein EOM35_02195 [Negativicutes bacterium]|nr:hypothetical protein [Negativicutes bacterium]
MIVKDLIKKVRFILSDTEINRWSDERLIVLLNEGLNNIAKDTILFVETAFVKLNNLQVEYDFSDFAIKILRIEYQGLPLKAFSHAEMDRKDPYWQTAEGSELKAYVIDKQKEARIKLYPILQNSNNTLVNFGSPFGIITGITYSEFQLEVASDFGDLGEVDASDYVKLYYIKRPPEITSILDEVELSSLIQEPVTHYIAAGAFRDNTDVQNRSIAVDEMNLYTSQLSSYVIEKAQNFSQEGYTTRYNPSGV